VSEPEGDRAAAVDDPDEQLRTLLGADPPAGIAALDPSVRGELAAVISDARSRQAKGLEEAFAAALKHVPFLARGIVRKVLLG
jgi:hypothetical protein